MKNEELPSASADEPRDITGRMRAVKLRYHIRSWLGLEFGLELGLRWGFGGWLGLR